MLRLEVNKRLDGFKPAIAPGDAGAFAEGAGIKLTGRGRLDRSWGALAGSL